MSVTGEDLNFGLFDFLDAVNSDDLRWEIGLNPNIPLDLDINSGVGEVSLDLADLTLTAVTIDSSVGEVDLILPAMDASYRVSVNGSVGDFSISVEEGAAVDLILKAGVGNFTVNVPRDAAVRVDAQTGVGDIRVPPHFDQIRGDDRAVGEQGTWETPNFDGAARRITIEFDGGVGGLTVR